MQEIKPVKKKANFIPEENDDDEFMLSDARSTELKARKKMSIKDF